MCRRSGCVFTGVLQFQILPKNIPEWILVLEALFLEFFFGCLGCSNGGAHRILSRGCNRGRGQEPMISQGWQPCLALELPTKSWPQIPWRADQRSISFQNPLLGSGMVAGFWVWILGGFHENARFCGLVPSGKIRKKSAPKWKRQATLPQAWNDVWTQVSFAVFTVYFSMVLVPLLKS